MTPAEVQQIDDAAAKRKLTRSEWIRRAVRQRSKRAAGPDWPAHWAWLKKQAKVIRGYPEDEIIALRR
jgi:hypothetical protein